MQTTSIALNVGNGLEYRKFTIPYTDLTGTAGLTQAVALFTLPAGGKVIGVYAKNSVAFAGTTTLTVSVGKSGTATHFSAALDIKAAVADTTVQKTALFKSGQQTALAVIATFTSTVDNLTALTAGSVDIWVLFMNTQGV